LAKTIHLNLYLDHMPGMGPGAAKGFGDPAAGGHVVVLDQDRVIQAEPVIRAPAHSHGVFLQGAKARRGLARVDDPRACSGDFGHIGPREAGDAGEASEKIEGRALGA
jgi:hypothetical protein